MTFWRATLWSALVASAIADDDQLELWRQATAAAQLAEGGANAPFVTPAPSDEWYLVTIADVSVGYMHTTMTEAASGDHETMEVMDVQVSRGSDTSRMAFETVFTESKLTPVEPHILPASEARLGGCSLMAYDQRFANNEVRMRVAMNTSGVYLTSYNGEKAHETFLPVPEDAWLGRLRARLEFTKQCREGATEVTVKTMRPELGPRVVDLSSTFVRIDEAWDGTSMVETSVWTVQISDVPVNMTEVYPTQGPLRCYRMLQMGLDMPFGYLLASLDEQQTALDAAKDDPNRVLPELVYTMFVPLERPIPNVNNVRRLKLLVRVKGNKGPAVLKLPSAGYQRVQKLKNTSRLHVIVDLKAPKPATAEELADEEYMNPSAMVDNTDEVVIELSHKIDGALRKRGTAIPKDDAEPLTPEVQTEVAYALRDLVHNHISSKHLSTAYATASETARTAAGDCTEHAVLLAAVLKARKIPARVCHGLVYVDMGGSAISGEVDGSGSGATSSGQFGWHMWSQALLNGVWVDMDATLHVPYNVGHVLVGTSSMSDKEAHNNHMQMAALIGNLEMTTLEISHDWDDATSDTPRHRPRDEL